MENIYIQENKQKVKATGEVLEKILADRQAEAEAKASAQAEAEAKATQRAALLTRLGITEEEARILLGGN
jgi:hypothetical protein